MPLRRSVRAWRRRRCRMAGVSRPAPCSSLSRWATRGFRPGANSSAKRRMNATETATQIRMRASMAGSDLDVHDLADPEESDDLEDDRRHEHQLADRVGKQEPDVGRVEAVDGGADRDGKHGQNVAAEATLRGVDPELPADGEAD